MSVTLLASLKNGDHSAMEEIYRQYWENIFDTAFKRLGDEDIAQDITQEIFISLWENRSKLNIEHNLDAYLYTAVKYRVINYFRSVSLKDKQKNALLQLMQEEVTAAADTRLILKDLSEELDQAIATLPEKMQRVFSMSRKQQKTIQEIANELNVSTQTVKNQLTSATKLLKKNVSYLALLALMAGLT